jgi:ribosomal protein S18 acetylase RimI-like enzyme
MAEVVVGRLDEADISAAGHMLAKAFHSDPLQVHVFPDAEERAQRSPAQFSALVRQGHLSGEVLATGGMTGVSVWMPPGQVVTAEQAAKSGFSDLPRHMGNDAFVRFGTVLDYLSDAHQKGIPAKCWYLMVVGVHPDQRGRGHGRALLAPIMARADAERMPICLETAQPDVKAFYESLGFKVAIESVHPGSGLRFWTYLREPPASEG